MKPATEGEKLFLLLRDTILNELGDERVRWSTVGQLWDDVAGTQKFTRYVKGAVGIHAMRRLLRYWQRERPMTLDPSNNVMKVRKFVRDEVFVGLDDDLAVRLARAVISAESTSFQSIGSGVRKSVIGRRKLIHCYLCDSELDASAPVGDPSHLTLEHVWPTSIGGDSIEENLLPACCACQNSTKDTASWEWLNIHNFVMKPDPSEEALDSVERKTKVASHFMRAAELADVDNLSLKAALVRIGHIKKRLTLTKKWPHFSRRQDKWKLG